jgi:hypothetical protein
MLASLVLIEILWLQPAYNGGRFHYCQKLSNWATVRRRSRQATGVITYANPSMASLPLNVEALPTKAFLEQCNAVHRLALNFSSLEGSRVSLLPPYSLSCLPGASGLNIHADRLQPCIAEQSPY